MSGESLDFSRKWASPHSISQNISVDAINGTTFETRQTSVRSSSFVYGYVMNSIGDGFQQ